MSQRVTTRTRHNRFVLPLGWLLRIVAAVLAAMLLIVLVATGSIQRAASGSAVADPASIAVQRSVSERDLERGYEQAVDHVRKGRALNLAITAQQADSITNKALADLFTLRHSAFVAVAEALGSSNDASEAYAKTAEQDFAVKQGQPQPSAAPVLLAPRLYAVVSRFNELATQLSDKAVGDLTQTATAPPSASGRPSPTPAPTR